MPITKASFQKHFSSNALPTSARPDLTGFIAVRYLRQKHLHSLILTKNLQCNSTICFGLALLIE